MPGANRGDAAHRETGHRSSYGRYLDQSKGRSPAAAAAGLGDLPRLEEDHSPRGRGGPWGTVSPARQSGGGGGGGGGGGSSPGGASEEDMEAEAWLAQMLEGRQAVPCSPASAALPSSVSDTAAAAAIGRRPTSTRSTRMRTRSVLWWRGHQRDVQPCPITSACRLFGSAPGATCLRRHLNRRVLSRPPGLQDDWERPISPRSHGGYPTGLFSDNTGGPVRCSTATKRHQTLAGHAAAPQPKGICLWQNAATKGVRL